MRLFAPNLDAYQFLLFAALLALMPVAIMGRAVLGIDLGSTNVRMGMLRSGTGSVDIVLSFESDRKTIAALGYRDRQTHFSQTAMNMFPKFPKNVFCRLYMLLGKPFGSSSCEAYASVFSHNLAADPKRGTVLIEEPTQGKMIPVEQLTATFFSHLLEQAEKHAGFPVVDCVIAIPPYYGQWERQAILDAAKIAGFNVLSLINGPSAAAFFKITTESDLTKPGTFIIYDSGSGGTSASLVHLNPDSSARAMEVKAVYGDPDLGGDLIDDRIVKFLKEKFEAAHPGVVLSPGKAMNKIYVEAARIKRILNANDHVSVNLDDLIDDLSLTIPRLQRDEIDALLSDLAERFVAPIKRVMADAGIPEDLTGINAILMIGGNSRHQYLLKCLKSTFPAAKLSVTLDPDEAIVKGATLFAVKLHPAFRLRPVEFHDISSQPLMAEYSKLPAEYQEGADLFSLPWADDNKSIQLFPPHSRLTSRKSLTLKHHDSLLMVLKEGGGGSGEVLARVAVIGFDGAVASVASAPGKVRNVISAKMRVPVELTVSGQALIGAPVAVIEYEEAGFETITVTETRSEKSSATAATAEAEQATTASTSSAASSEAKDATTAAEVQTKAVTKKHTESITLKHQIQYRIPPMSSEAIEASRVMINEIKAEEMKKIALATARNDLEQLVYQWQSDVASGWFADFSNKNEKSDMTKAVSKASSLLQDPKVTQQQDPKPYQQVIDEIKAIEAAVKARQSEWEGRAEAVEGLQATFAQVQEFLTAQVTVPEEERAVTDEDLNELKADLAEDEKWLADLNKKQSSLAKHDQPVLLIADIQKRSAKLKKYLAKLKAKKKPFKQQRPVKEEQKQPTKDEKEQSQEQQQQDSPTQEESFQQQQQQHQQQQQQEHQNVPNQEEPVQQESGQQQQESESEQKEEQPEDIEHDEL